MIVEIVLYNIVVNITVYFINRSFYEVIAANESSSGYAGIDVT